MKRYKSTTILVGGPAGKIVQCQSFRQSFQRAKSLQRLEDSSSRVGNEEFTSIPTGQGSELSFLSTRSDYSLGIPEKLQSLKRELEELTETSPQTMPDYEGLCGSLEEEDRDFVPQYSV